MSKLDTIDKVRYIIALVAVVAIIGTIMVLANSDRTAKPMAINGDQLGMDTGETAQEYRQRAEDSLVNAGDPAFALVTFDRPLTPATAGELLDQAEPQRVSAALTDRYLPIALPEPTGDHTRGEVIEQQLINNADRELIRAVVVHDNGDRLRALAAEEGVFAVEALPADAAWARFGIRPVTTQ